MEMCLKETNIHTVHPDSHSVLMWTSLPQHWLGQLLLVTVISLATTWSVHCGSCRGIYSSHSAFSLIIMVEGLSFKVPPFFRRSKALSCFFPPEMGISTRGKLKRGLRTFWKISFFLNNSDPSERSTFIISYGQKETQWMLWPWWVQIPAPLHCWASEDIWLRILRPELASPHL